VQAVLDAMSRSSEPPSEAESLAAWRRVLDQGLHSGLEIAIARLLDLKDVASREKIAAAIERLQKLDPRRADVARLAERLAAEMPEPPVPK
jgi:hypothetical protein